MAAVGSPLDSAIDRSSLVCLNEDAAHPVGNCFLDDESCLQSDADPQLLINIPFLEPVQISSVRFASSEEAGEEAPAFVKLFVNRPDFGFDDCETEVAVQDLSFDLQGGGIDSTVPLRIARFNNVHTLQVFVQDNHGGDVTRLQFLQLFGNRTGTRGIQDVCRSTTKPSQQKPTRVDGVGASAAVSNLCSQTSEQGIAQTLVDMASSGHRRGRELVRESVGVFLAAAPDDGERRRRALQLVAACRHLPFRREGREGSLVKGSKKAQQMARQGLMGGLEHAISSVSCKICELIAQAPPWAALQLLRAMPAQFVIQEADTLHRFLQDLLAGNSIPPSDVILVGEWIGKGLEDTEIGGHFQDLAATFSNLVAMRARDDDNWCPVAADSLCWLPASLQSDDLKSSAARCPAKVTSPHSSSLAASAPQEWSVDLQELPQLKLPESVAVVWVDDLESLNTMAHELSGASSIGVDTEWGDGVDRSLSLIQIAIHARCYIVDVLALHDVLGAALELIFSQRVVGWGFKEDSRRLALLHDPLKSLLSRVNDLQPLVRRRLGLLQMPSLQRACAELLGVALDKGEQCSDWDRRPLTAVQIHYAACDAWVLLNLAQELGEEPSQ